MVNRPAAALAGAVLLILLSGCDDAPPAPTDLGVCWTTKEPSPGKVSFTPILRGARNLESCAATLEGAAMTSGARTLTGAYQGQYVFITPDMVQSATSLHGARYRLFDAATRGKVDTQLRWRIEDERHPSAFAPTDRQAPPGSEHR
jgi:hypothetical protein